MSASFKSENIIFENENEKWQDPIVFCFEIFFLKIDN